MLKDLIIFFIEKSPTSQQMISIGKFNWDLLVFNRTTSIRYSLLTDWLLWEILVRAYLCCLRFQFFHIRCLVFQDNTPVWSGVLVDDCRMQQAVSDVFVLFTCRARVSWRFFLAKCAVREKSHRASNAFP